MRSGRLLVLVLAAWLHGGCTGDSSRAEAPKRGGAARALAVAVAPVNARTVELEVLPACQALGLAVEATGKNGLFEIAGVDPSRVRYLGILVVEIAVGLVRDLLRLRRPLASGAHACTAQNGAHWWAPSRSLTVATWTQHWVRRSSIIVLMSMNGFTVIRSTRSPIILRSRWCWPGRVDVASAVSVPMPRSQFWQMSRQIELIDGCDSDAKALAEFLLSPLPLLLP